MLMLVLTRQQFYESQPSFLSICKGGVPITSLELNHPINIVRIITPSPIDNNSIQSNANVISKKNLAKRKPLAKERRIPVSAENNPSHAYSINVILII